MSTIVSARGSGRQPAGQAARYAVLCSAGLDSAVLVAHLAQADLVQPLYVSVGLAWETAEQDYLSRLMRTQAFAARVLPPLVLRFEMQDVYPPTHWAIRGTPPAYDDPDEDVYLVGRNVVLLTKAAVTAASRGIPEIAIGPLAGNPFPDATPEFFTAMAHALTLGLDHRLTVQAPFRTMDKSEVIRLGATLGVDLALTLSCMNPTRGLHCGQCNKCRERRDAFAEAHVEDPTVYATQPPR